MKFIDLTGQKFSRLIVIKRVPKPEHSKGHGTYWLCKCDCGNSKDVICTGDALKSGKVKSCGCYAKEQNKKRLKKYNTYDLSGEYGIGYTSKGEEFYFDLEDYDKIKDYCWGKANGYICCTMSNCKNIRMHSLILNHKTDIYYPIDHINRIKHDNRKENLRVCTITDNARNRHLQRNNTSGIIGVIWHYINCKWIARINIGNKKVLHLGSFINKEDAIKTRLQAELNIYGEFAPQKHLFNKYNIK